MDILASTGNKADLQAAINSAISGGGSSFNVYVPHGDWIVNQNNPVTVNLSALPANAWLNIIGKYTNLNSPITQQNGYAMTGPDVILRSTVPETDPWYWGDTFNIVGSTYSSGNFNYTQSANRHIRISGFSILGYVTMEADTANPIPVNNPQSSGIDLACVDGFRVDHCAIDSNGNSAVAPSCSKGLIDHCSVTNLYHKAIGGILGYGVGVYGNSGIAGGSTLGQPTWIKDVSKIAGKFDWQGIPLDYEWWANTGYATPVYNQTPSIATTSAIPYHAGPVYIEDNYFYLTRHAVSSSGWGYWVFRYNTVKSGLPTLSLIDQHGGNNTTQAWINTCTRGSEAYMNILDGSPNQAGDYGHANTGGSCLFFKNTVSNVARGFQFGNRGQDNNDPNDPEYIHDCWIWGNTFSNVGLSIYFQNNPGGEPYPGVDYFNDNCSGYETPTTPAPLPYVDANNVGGPSVATNFASHYTYVPYTYPHPWTKMNPYLLIDAIPFPVSGSYVKL